MSSERSASVERVVLTEACVDDQNWGPSADVTLRFRALLAPGVSTQRVVGRARAALAQLDLELREKRT